MESFGRGLIPTGRGGIDIDVERRHVDVSLYGGARTVEFDGCFDTGGVESAKNVGFAVMGYVSGGLLNFVDLRLPLKAVEQKYAGIFGQPESGGDLRELRL